MTAPTKDLLSAGGRAGGERAPMNGSAAHAGAPPRDTLRLVTSALSGAAVLDHAFERPVSLLGDGVVSAGDLGILYGVPYLGKTWLALQLALSWARGEPFFGLAAGEPINVGFVELELHGVHVQDRLRKLGPIPDTFHLVTRPRLTGAFDLVNRDGLPIDLDELRTFIIERNLKAVFIDALQRATSCEQADFSPLLMPLDVLRAETGCAIILVHHEPKGADPGPDGDADALRGDSRLAGFATFCMRVVRFRGQQCFRIWKASVTEAPPPVWFKQHPKIHSLGGVPYPCDSPEDRAEQSRARTFAALRALGAPSTAEQVRDQIPAGSRPTLQTVKNHLEHYVGQGAASHFGKAPGRGGAFLYGPSGYDATNAANSEDL